MYNISVIIFGATSVPSRKLLSYLLSDAGGASATGSACNMLAFSQQSMQ